MSLVEARTRSTTGDVPLLMDSSTIIAPIARCDSADGALAQIEILPGQCTEIAAAAEQWPIAVVEALHPATFLIDEDRCVRAPHRLAELGA